MERTFCSLQARVYSRIRHPIYFFASLALLGAAFCLRSVYFTSHLRYRGCVSLLGSESLPGGE